MFHIHCVRHNEQIKHDSKRVSSACLHSTITFTCKLRVCLNVCTPFLVFNIFGLKDSYRNVGSEIDSNKRHTTNTHTHTHTHIYNTPFIAYIIYMYIHTHTQTHIYVSVGIVFPVYLKNFTEGVARKIVPQELQRIHYISGRMIPANRNYILDALSGFRVQFSKDVPLFVTVTCR